MKASLSKKENSSLKHGLDDKVVSGIISIFERYPNFEKVVLFGSRAKGNFFTNSDIDLAIFGKDITLQNILAASNQLDELMIPQQIDLANYKTIAEPELKEHIDRVGIILWARS